MFASQGALRSTGRKLANGLRSTRNHETHSTNTHGGTRALHLQAAQTAHHLQPITLGKTIIEHSIQSIRPRTPPNQVFSATRNFVTSIFNRLSAPGIRVPTNIPGVASGPALHTRLAKNTIYSNLSTPTRYALHSRSLNTGGFLPRAPAAPRPPVAMQMGLGTARNFSSGRPIFQNLVDNVPVALRSIYQVDLDNDFARRSAKLMRPVHAQKAAAEGPKLKAKQTKISKQANKENEKEEEVSAAELEHYFRAPTPPAVTTYILIPLAPTPSNRLPLASRDPSTSTGRFIPLQQVGEIHTSHTNHALRVSTLFSRLDVANVWANPGVSCTPYSGCPRKAPMGDTELEGVCTFLKVEFVGWTLAEVRAVTGEIGQGWCVFEEVWHDEAKGKGMLSEAEDDDDETDSVFSPLSSLASELTRSPAQADPTRSFVMPTLDFSSSFLSEQSALHDAKPAYECGEDPWVEDDLSDSDSVEFLSRNSSSSSLGVVSEGGLGLIIDPPSENGWFSVNRGTVPTTRFDEGPQEIFF